MLSISLKLCHESTILESFILPIALKILAKLKARIQLEVGEERHEVSHDTL